MKKALFVSTVAISLTGCLNPKLCDSTKSINPKKGLETEHIKYFKNKKNLSVAEAHSTILPIVHTKQHLQKKGNGYKYDQNVSFLGGLLFEGRSSTIFDKSGKPSNNSPQSASMNLFSGLLYDSNFSVDQGLTGSSNITFLFKAFGVKQEIGGSKYYTIFWMPMRFTDNRIRK